MWRILHLSEKTIVTEVTIGEEVIEEAIEMELEDSTVMSHQETAIVMTEVQMVIKLSFTTIKFIIAIFKTLRLISIQKCLDDRRDGNRGYGFSRDDRGFGGDRYRRDDNNR